MPNKTEDGSVRQRKAHPTVSSQQRSGTLSLRDAAPPGKARRTLIQYSLLILTFGSRLEHVLSIIRLLEYLQRSPHAPVRRDNRICH